MNKKLIAVLIPTRGRVNRLERCLNSFNKKTKNKEKIELIVKIDNDDLDTLDFLKNYKSEIDLKIIVSEREDGYGSLHKFYNEMANASNAEYLYIYNDDIWMDTDGWEEIVQKYSGEHFVILAHNTYVQDGAPKIQSTGTNVFTPNYNGNPIFPRKILDICGYISDHQLVDHWFVTVISKLAKRGYSIEKWVDIKCYTDRPDGNYASSDLDDTYKDGRAHINWNQDEKKKDEYVQKIINYLKN